ncbi:hypothetical protein Vafri_16130, partial [Volvox africanus]
MRSATLRKLRRAVDLIRIAMLLKAGSSSSGNSRREGALYASSPQLRQPPELSGAESLKAELSNMDLSPKIKRGRHRRTSVDGFLRDFLSRNFAQHQRQHQTQRRSLDRESTGGQMMGSRYYDDDSDEEDTTGQSQPTKEPPYEIGLPVPPPPRASFEYFGVQDGTCVPWSAQSSRAASFESATSANRSNQLTGNETNRQPPTHRSSDSAISGGGGGRKEVPHGN